MVVGDQGADDRGPIDLQTQQTSASPERTSGRNPAETMEQSAQAMNPFIDDQQEIDSHMQPRNMFSVKFGASQTQNTTHEVEGSPGQYGGYQVDPNCRRDLPANYMADGGAYTMGIAGQQEMQGHVPRPETGTFSNDPRV